jgi:hypothetical protein
MILALIAFGGGLVGALVQATLTSRFERSKFIRDNRRSAYQDLLTGLANLSAYEANERELAKARALVIEARCRIGLFGSKNVVQLLADVFENSTSFKAPMDQHRLHQVMLEMRRDSVGSEDRGIKIDLSALVFASAHEKDKE